METWRNEDMETLTQGDMATWTHGDFFGHRDMDLKYQGSEVLRKKIKRETEKRKFR
jgi:hypothetical protein